VKGGGRGGRNQEVALAACLALAERRLPAVVLSGGTDGIDGPTDAAGAIATPEMLSSARTLGLDAADFLARNDTYNFFAPLGGLLLTGPTDTNVGDIQVVIFP
jgi:glycerate-2-kinase